MPSSIRYINQSAPFWDFIASMEEGEHPFFGRQGPSNHPPPPPHHARGHPWGPPPPFMSHDNLPHRGPPGPPAGEDEKDASPDTVQNDVDMKRGDEEDTGAPDPPEEEPREGSGDERRGWGRHGRGRCQRGKGPGQRHCGKERGARGWGHGHHGHHGWGPQARGFGWGGPGGFDFRNLAGLFQPQTGADNDGDFTPEADVFDTPTSYVVHLSLPGANKEDIGVTFEPEVSELVIAGVVHRLGDETFLKTIAMDERKVGAFERKIRLGTRAKPAHVDIEAISAKLENGILIVEVPKMIGDFVDIKKVDIE